MLNELNDKFTYVYSSSVEYKVQIKIGTLDGQRRKPSYEELLADPMLRFSGLYTERFPDLYVHCQIFSSGMPLVLPVTTSYKHFTMRWDWNEWVTFGVHYNELPRNSVLALTIYDCGGPGKLSPVGGTTITMFGKHGVFRQGLLDLKVWRNRVADGNWPSTTPGKSQEKGKDQMQKLSKFVKKHRNGEITKIDWLDRHTFREIEGINANERSQSNFMYLTIQFPIIMFENVQLQFEQQNTAQAVTKTRYLLEQSQVEAAQMDKLASSREKPRREANLMFRPETYFVDQTEAAQMDTKFKNNVSMSHFYLYI